jgi:hypothetical protein
MRAGPLAIFPATAREKTKCNAKAKNVTTEMWPKRRIVA